MRRLTIVLSVFGVLLGAGAWGQAPTPKGDQFQVNTYTTSNQGNPSVAVGPLGNFVVVWQSTGSPGNDTSGDSIQAQRYDAAGNTVGPQFQVNTYTTSSQREAAVAMDNQGNFVVVWDGTPDGDDWGVRGQRFDPAGNLLGNEFQVNTYITERQRDPAIAMDSAGNFVVVWDSEGSYGSDTSYESVQGQLYDNMGSPIGGQFQINTSTYGRQDRAKAAFDGLGNFIVVWDHVPQDSVRGQLYDETGAAVGGQFEIATTGYASYPDVAADSVGNFAVTWTGYAAGTDNSDGSIQAQRFDASGNTVGSQFQVNTYTMYWQEASTIAMDPDGNMIIIWESEGSLGDDMDEYSIQAQYYDSSKAPVGGEFQVNTHTPGDQLNPAVGIDGTGDFVVTWNSDNAPGDMSSRSIHARRYSAGADPIFSGFFESGDTSEWTTSVP